MGNNVGDCTVSNSYATGAVTGTGDNVGGLVGFNDRSTVTASYYNSETTGQSDTGKGDPKTTAELLTPTGSTGIYQTWNATDWDFGTNEEYPVLKIDVNGNGTVGDAADLLAQRPPPEDAFIEVSTLEQLNAIRYDLDGNGIVSATNQAAYSAAFSDPLPVGIIRGYQLINNLDFNDTNSYASGTINMDWTTGSGWSPIGNNSSRFTAIFEGNGHTISNLFINRSSTSNLGFFGYVKGNNAELRNIGLLEVKVTGRDVVGGLVGLNNQGTVSNSYVTGAVTGNEYVGGLVGGNDGTVSGSYATGSVTGILQIGGLVGENSNLGNISNSYATGSVMGGNTGGLVGVNYADISNSYATGSVTGLGSNIGGLVGNQLGGTVTASYYNSETTGQSDTGKGVAKTTTDLLAPTGSTGIYGTWSGADWDFGTDGQYPVLKIDVDGNGTAGEVADLRVQRPLRFRQTSYAFAILNTASINDVVGIVRAVPEDVNNELTYSMGTSTGFSISSEAETNNLSKVGQISVKAVLSTNTYTLNVEVTEAGGTATVEVRIKVGASLDADTDGLIEVSTLEQLNAIRYDLDGDGTPTEAGMTEYTTAFGTGICTDCTGYELMSNLDFAESRWVEGASGGDAVVEGWDPIGDFNPVLDIRSPFRATFEGNGHTISNLFIDRSSTDFVGLFGYVSESAALRNIGLLEVKVTGNDNVGGLVGYNLRSTVSGSYATGSVTGNDNVGGLVGINFEDSMVSNSYATGVVTGTVDDVGGLVGINYADISNSYATGSVTGNNNVGGLVGRVVSTGTVSNSYATGAVTGTVGNVGGLVGGNNAGTITVSYYNSQTTGKSDTGKGVGKTTAELVAPTDYTGIYGTWNDGSTDYWYFGTNEQYPVLKIDVNGNGTAGDADDLALQQPPRLSVDFTSLDFLAGGEGKDFIITSNAIWMCGGYSIVVGLP